MLRYHDICLLVESRLFMGVPLAELMLQEGGKLINTCQHVLKKLSFFSISAEEHWHVLSLELSTCRIKIPPFPLYQLFFFFNFINLIFILILI